MLKKNTSAIPHHYGHMFGETLPSIMNTTPQTTSVGPATCFSSPPPLTLTCFQAFTSLKVNAGKSEIVPVREVGNIDALATILRCRVGSLPMKYLEMPLGTPYKTASI